MLPSAHTLLYVQKCRKIRGLGCENRVRESHNLAHAFSCISVCYPSLGGWCSRRPCKPTRRSSNGSQPRRRRSGGIRRRGGEETSPSLCRKLCEGRRPKVHLHNLGEKYKNRSQPGFYLSSSKSDAKLREKSVWRPDDAPGETLLVGRGRSCDITCGSRCAVAIGGLFPIPFPPYIILRWR